ncbi:energy transducer TonB [Shimia sp.]|uniref:energy transducer TonB n=1 Tax=Shimia sp. TaxID=1954381 RepID=UPI0035669A0E
MHIGHYISGLAHAGVIGWLLFGAGFRAAPPPFEVTGVSVVTLEEFDQLTARERPPLPATEVDTPVAPTLRETAPELSSDVDAAPDQETPDTATATPPDDAPDLGALSAPAPAEVADEAPELEAPGEEMAVLIPRDATRPMVRPSERVAPAPIAPPAPDTRIDDIAQEASRPDDSASDKVEEPRQDTAPEAASTEIVTEAEEQVALAPKASLRPVLRPGSRPAPRPQPAGSGKPASAATDAAVAAALAEQSAAQAAAPSGPPLTRGEKDAMRLSVQTCWVVDVGSQAANVTVTVGFALDREGRVSGPVRLLSSENGSGQVVETAFQAARRAILRCQRGGYKLPIEKYDHWREIEITFNPEKMRLK